MVEKNVHPDVTDDSGRSPLVSMRVDVLYSMYIKPSKYYIPRFMQLSEIVKIVWNFCWTVELM